MRVVKGKSQDINRNDESNLDIVQADGEVKFDYSNCIQFLQHAIEALSEAAKTDDVAREAIANISVVIFDLQS